MIELYYLQVPSLEDFEKKKIKLLEFLPSEDQLSYLQNPTSKAGLPSLLGKIITYWLAKQRIHSFSKVSFSYHTQGKPYFKEFPSFYFNISHSLDHVVVGISNHELGVDIEKERIYKPSIAERFLHPNEYLFLESLKEDQSFFFTSIWNLKESYVKFTGEGISNTFKKFYIEFDKQTHSICIKGGNFPVYFKLYQTIPNYLISICSLEIDFPEAINTIKFDEIF